MLAAPNPYAKEIVNMSSIPMQQLFDAHRALKAAGIELVALRNRIIALEYLRTHNFEEWVKARARLSVFDVIEVDGERMVYLLTKDRGGFKRDEIKLIQPRQTKQGRAVS